MSFMSKGSAALDDWLNQGESSKSPQQQYIDQFDSGRINDGKGTAFDARYPKAAFPFQLPETPDLTDAAVQQARTLQAGNVGAGRNSSFLSGGISGPPSSGKSFLGG